MQSSAWIAPRLFCGVEGNLKVNETLTGAVSKSVIKTSSRNETKFCKKPLGVRVCTQESTRKKREFQLWKNIHNAESYRLKMACTYCNKKILYDEEAVLTIHHSHLEKLDELSTWYECLFRIIKSSIYGQSIICYGMKTSAQQIKLLVRTVKNQSQQGTTRKDSSEL